MHTPQDTPPTAPPAKDNPPHETNPVEDPPVHPDQPSVPEPCEAPVNMVLHRHSQRFMEGT